MLTAERNLELCQVSAGTPMGGLLRRYWHPIAPATALDDQPIRSVRLLGEDLVLFRLADGELGLVEPRCAHRGAGLALGYIQGCGLRCAYHGWQYDRTGQCVDTPLEPADSTLKSRVQIRAYPVQTLAGLVFAYLGPLPAPPLPRWDLLVWPNSIRQIEFYTVKCNWNQCVENIVDLLHTLVLHGDAFQHQLERQGRWDPVVYPRVAEFAGIRHPPALEWEAFDHGVRMRLPNGRVAGHALLFPCIAWKGGSAIRQEMMFKVPIDDTHTLHINMQIFTPPAGVTAPLQDRIPATDLTGLDLPFTDNILTQDVMIWESQGEIADRSREILGVTDKGVIAWRRMLSEQLRGVAEGKNPINVLAEPVDCIRVGPTPGDSQGNVLAEMLHGFDRYYQDSHGGALELLREIFVSAMRPAHVRDLLQQELGPALAAAGDRFAETVALTVCVGEAFSARVLLVNQAPHVLEDDPAAPIACSLRLDALALPRLLSALLSAEAGPLRLLSEEGVVQVNGDLAALASLRGWNPPVRTGAERLKQAGAMLIRR